MSNRIWIYLLLAAAGMGQAETARGDGPIIAFGAERQAIRATPVLERENRPLHFYGNTVRRLNSRPNSGTRTFPFNSRSGR